MSVCIKAKYQGDICHCSQGDLHCGIVRCKFFAVELHQNEWVCLCAIEDRIWLIVHLIIFSLNPLNSFFFLHLLGGSE